MIKTPLTLNKSNAVAVRLGEKRILHDMLSKVKTLIQIAGAAGVKRKGNQEEGSSKSRSKKARK